jgi:hypothetical protein
MTIRSAVCRKESSAWRQLSQIDAEPMFRRMLSLPLGIEFSWRGDSKRIA